MVPFYAFFRASAVGVVYLFGYLNWSIGWFVAPVAFLVIKDQWKTAAEKRRNIAKAVAMSSEKDVVLARLNDLPAWVFFPDIERVEWLNRIIKQIWPNVNHYARDLIRDTIQPIIKESLDGFKFERIILGDCPLRIGGVKVYDKNVARNEIIMDLDFSYAGDCDITFSYSKLKGGIRDFQLQGMLRVVMKPLITTIPLVGGLQVFFLNNPTIDFNLVGVADILDMPGLSDALRKVIVDVVSSQMVLPNKFPIKLCDDVDAMEIKIPEPEGVLRVHVVEAKHLMKKDIGVLGKGKSDPYAVLTVGAQECRTPTIDNSVDPKWDHWCEFILDHADSASLDMHLYDYDAGQKDENLGRASIEVSNIVKKGTDDMWVTLEDAKHGMVHVRFTWLTLSMDYSDLTAALKETEMLQVMTLSTGVLTVYIDSAQNLPQARSSSQPDPFVVLRVDKSTQKTQTIMRTADPVWEQGFNFFVGNPNSDQLYLNIIDNKTKKELGEIVYNIRQLGDKKHMHVIKQPFKLHKSGHDSKLIWSLQLRILKSPSASSLEDEPRCSVVSNASTESKPPLNKRESSISLDNQFQTDPQFETSEVIEDSSASLLLNQPGDDSTVSDGLLHRTLSTTSSTGEAGLGRIQLTLRYSVQRQVLVVVVHKVCNIPVKDPSSIPDPYVKLYLLPERAKETKRKTQVLKDNCNPVFDETFEYVISQGELYNKLLEVTVCTQKQVFYTSSNILGLVLIDLSKLNLNQAYNSWFDLKHAPEGHH